MIHDAIAAALPGMQSQAESLMQDTCRISDVTGTTTNPDGTVTSTSSTVYEGKCKLQNQQAYPSNPDAGGHSWTLVPSWLQLPVATSGGVKVDHVVEILTSVNADNVGRQFRVRSSGRKTWQTAARFLIEEVAG